MRRREGAVYVSPSYRCTEHIVESLISRLEARSHGPVNHESLASLDRPTATVRTQVLKQDTPQTKAATNGTGIGLIRSARDLIEIRSSSTGLSYYERQGLLLSNLQLTDRPYRRGGPGPEP